MNDRMQQQTRGIDQNMPLVAFDLLTSVVAMRIDTAAFFSAFHALAVDHAGGWAGLPSHLLPAFHVQSVMDLHQGSIVLPTLKEGVLGAPRRKIPGDVAPLAASTEH